MTAAVTIAESLVRLGLSTSKIRTYATPRPKKVIGWPTRRPLKIKCGSKPPPTFRAASGFNCAEPLPQFCFGKLLNDEVHKRPGLAGQQFVLGVVDGNIAVVDVPVGQYPYHLAAVEERHGHGHAHQRNSQALSAGAAGGFGVAQAVMPGLSTSGRHSRSTLVNCQERTRPVCGERIRRPLHRDRSSGSRTGGRCAR